MGRWWHAWGVVRSRFAQIGGAWVVGMAGRAHEHIYMVDSSGMCEPSIRTRYTACGGARAGLCSQRLYLLWVDERDTGRTMVLVGNVLPACPPWRREQRKTCFSRAQHRWRAAHAAQKSCLPLRWYVGALRVVVERASDSCGSPE